MGKGTSAGYWDMEYLNRLASIDIMQNVLSLKTKAKVLTMLGLRLP